MSTTPTPQARPLPTELFADRDALRRLAEEIDAQAGIGTGPSRTPEQVQALMRAEGIRAEDNLFSRRYEVIASWRYIIRARYPDEDPDEIAALAHEV